MEFHLAYAHLTLAHSKGQGQCHAQFDCQYLILLADLHMTLAHSNGQGQGHPLLDCDNL